MTTPIPNWKLKQFSYWHKGCGRWENLAWTHPEQVLSCIFWVLEYQGGDLGALLLDMGAAIQDTVNRYIELANHTGDCPADLWCTWHILIECMHTWQFIESWKGSTHYHKNWNPDQPVHLWLLSCVTGLKSLWEFQNVIFKGSQKKNSWYLPGYINHVLLNYGP